MENSGNSLLLYGIFSRLRAAGIPLSTRDYLDGLDALMLFPEPFHALAEMKPTNITKTRHPIRGPRRVRERPPLVWLIQTLWARTPEEHVIVDHVLSCDLPLPSAQGALQLRKTLQSLEGTEDLRSVTKPVPFSPWSSDYDVPEKDNDARVLSSQQMKVAFNQADSSSGDSQYDSINADINDEGDFPLPELHPGKNAPINEQMLSKNTIISPLWLLSLWRRFSLPILETDPNTIDVNATIKHAVNIGALIRPVYGVRSVNKAKLLVLLDVGHSMMPWDAFQKDLLKSLRPALSRLNEVDVFYFNQAPGKTVFSNPALLKPESLEKVIKACPFHSILIFSDLEAVTQSPSVKVEQRIAFFLSLLNSRDRQRVLWLNPVPKARWHNSNMPLLYGRHDIHCLELHAEDLLEGIDFLRGNQ